MRALFLLLLLAGAYVASAETTNICHLKYNYCPRDPGCKTYTMSVHNVTVFDTNVSKPAIDIADVSIGSELSVTVHGRTSLKEVPVSGSYRVYALQGGNVAEGTLTEALHLDGSGGFVMHIPFAVSVANFGDSAHTLFEFGIDVFQKGSGSDEGMCIEVASDTYVAREAAKASPPFNMLCKDNGDGSFTGLPAPGVPMHSFVLPSPACNPPPPPPPSKCALDWYYCPRDPGCVTYTMSAEHVEFDTHDAAGYKAGDKVTLKVNGTTTMTEVPGSGSYRVYDLAGKNAAAGVLSDVLSLPSKGAFSLAIPFVLTSGSFSSEWFQFGIDIFQKKSGSDEGMCIEVANPTYVAAMQAKTSPLFNMDCIDEGGGHFLSKLPTGVPEKVSDVQCVL